MYKKNFYINIILLFSLLWGFTTPSFAQNNVHHKKEHTLPTWAKEHGYNGQASVYFPDYYSFYDPKRGGYVFWEHDRWIFSPALPPYMRNADMQKTRIKILKGLSLDLHPERNYPHYMKLYPPVEGNDKVPVPTMK